MIYLHTLSRTNIGGSYQTEPQIFLTNESGSESTTILLIVCHLALSDKTKKKQQEWSKITTLLQFTVTLNSF